MKLKLLTTLAGGTLLMTTLQAQEIITQDKLPDAVARVVRTETTQGGVKQIQKHSADGKTVYEVTLPQQNGSDRKIYLDNNGSYFKGDLPKAAQVAVSTPAPGGLQLAQLPDAAQRVIKTETTSGSVKEIRQINHNGREIYHVTLSKADGAEKVVYINKDGSYVSDKAAEVAVGKPAQGQTGTERSMLNGATKVAFRDLPEKLRHPIQVYAGTTSVEDVDRGVVDGKPVYEVAFKQNGKNVEFRMDESGNVIQDEQNRQILGNVPLGTMSKMRFGHVPENIQNVMKQNAGGAQIAEVTKGMLDNQAIYQARFTHNGYPMQMRVFENGTVMQMPTVLPNNK